MRRIAHISDLHFGRHAPAVAEALLGALEALRPDVVAVSGDLTQRARRREFHAARAFLGRIAAPTLVVPGNHDVPLWNLAERLVRPLARYRRLIAPGPALIADAEIALLGVTAPWRGMGAGGRISPGRVAEIRAGFGGAPAGALRVLVTHHPLLATPEQPGLAAIRGARRALAAIGEAGVRVLLAGHHHRPYSADASLDHLAAKRSVLVVQAGTAISQRLRGGPNSFNILDIGPARVDCTPHVWTGSAFTPRRTSRFIADGQRWRLALPHEGP